MEPRIKLGTNSIEKTGSQTGHRRIEGKKGKRKREFTYLGGVRFKKIGSGKLTTSCFKKRKGIRNLCANHEDAVTARNRGWGNSWISSPSRGHAFWFASTKNEKVSE